MLRRFPLMEMGIDWLEGAMRIRKCRLLHWHPIQWPPICFLNPINVAICPWVPPHYTKKRVCYAERDRGGICIIYWRFPIPSPQVFPFKFFDIHTQDNSWYNQCFADSDFPRCHFSSLSPPPLLPLPSTPLPFIIYK